MEIGIKLTMGLWISTYGWPATRLWALAQSPCGNPHVGQRRPRMLEGRP